jgi:hypothetical protein
LQCDWPYAYCRPVNESHTCCLHRVTERRLSICGRVTKLIDFGWLWDGLWPKVPAVQQHPAARQFYYVLRNDYVIEAQKPRDCNTDGVDRCLHVQLCSCAAMTSSAAILLCGYVLITSLGRKKLGRAVSTGVYMSSVAVTPSSAVAR